MKITRSQEAEKALVQQIGKYYDNRKRDGIHVTDLLAVRQSYFKKTDPRPTTEREVGYFLAGEAVHLAIQRALGLEEEEQGQFEEIWYSIDIPVGDVPGELKGSRKATIPEQPEENYVEQVLCYAGAKNKNEAYVLVFYYNPGRSKTQSSYPQFRVWKIDLTPTEVEQIRRDMVDKKNLLLRAIETKDFQSLPLCRAWMCKECKWLRQCAPPGRYDAVTGRLIETR